MWSTFYCMIDLLLDVHVRRRVSTVCLLSLVVTIWKGRRAFGPWVSFCLCLCIYLYTSAS
jgi:hypothetical protein